MDVPTRLTASVELTCPPQIGPRGVDAFQVDSGRRRFRQ